MKLSIEWTRKALSIPENVRDDLAGRLERLRPFFAEMKPRMKIGITRSYEGLAFQSNDGFVKLMVEVRRTRNGTWKLPTYWTLAHELMHLAQFNSKGIPGGERATDIYALARVTPNFIDESPSYLVVPRGLRSTWTREHAKIAHDLALEALRLRNRGMKRYAKWWEDEFERIMKKKSHQGYA